MEPLKTASDSVHWFMSELGANIIVKTGIPSDRYHLGKLILHSLKDAPEFLMQIDAATGKSENYKSVLERSVRCAACFKELGLKMGDVIVLMAPNHIDLCIPMYAALYMGVMVAALDAESSVLELEHMFNCNRAKIIFTQSERTPVVKTALANIKHNALFVSFDAGSDCITFAKMMEQYGTKADVDSFKATDLDPADAIAFLTSTSGSTGMPKATSLTHKNFALALPYVWTSLSTFPTPTRLVLILSPLQWLSAGFHFLFSPILRYTRLQSSATVNQDNFVEIVNQYKPTFTIVNPTFLIALIKPGNFEKCDLTCFEFMLVGGSAVPEELLDNIKAITPNTKVIPAYGMSEVAGLSLYSDFPKPGSSGRPIGLFDYRLVDFETKEDITQPNVNGELWLKGPTVCKGYYNNPEADAQAFEDGWIKTGDIFYRDENYFFYFVDRLKVLLKYKNHQISPVELEAVIRKHPGVLDVAVSSIPEPECGDLPVACVVVRKGCTVTAQEVKDLVKNTLADTKQLRGGVIFLKELPLTTTTKLHRIKLKEMVKTMKRE